MSTHPNDDARPPSDDGADGDDPAVVIELEDGAALMYDPDNAEAWIRTDAAATLDASV